MNTNRRKGFGWVTALAVVILQLSLAGPAFAFDGDVDPTFGSGGVVRTAVGSVNARAEALVRQPDGKLVAAGSGTGFGLVRYHQDGSLDDSFGSGGIVDESFGGLANDANALVLQPDGKLVVAGGTTSSDRDFAIARFNADGSPGTSFGSGGFVSTKLSTDSDEANALVLQPDGKLVAAGYRGESSAADFAVARINTDGSLDDGFGTGGVVTTDVTSAAASGTTRDVAFGMVLAGDGRIVVGGTTGSGSTVTSTLAAYRSDGGLDQSFGDGGRVITQYHDGFGDESFIDALAIQPDGRIVAGGALCPCPSSASSMTVTRYEPDGALDSTFGNVGRVVYSYPKTTDTGSSQYGYTAAYAVAVAPGGAIVVAGKWVNQDVAFPSDDACGDLTVARFTATGEPDTSFLTPHAGAVTDLGRCDWAQAVIVQPDGSIVAAGFVQPDAGDQGGFALVRYKDSTDEPAGSHDDASQTTSLTIEDAPPPPGALTVSVQSVEVGFGSLEAGATAQANVGDITYENTLGNGRSWSAVVAATSLTDGTSVVPFSVMTFAPGAQITGEGSDVPSPGVAAAFTGADTTPGSTYSDPVTTVTAPSSAQGAFTQSGSTAAVQAPDDAVPGAYTGTVQYTITG